MAVINSWGGASDSDSFRVIAKVTGGNAWLAVSTSPSFSEATFFGPFATIADGAVQMAASGLEPNTVYYWGVSEDGESIDFNQTGRCPTHPEVGKPASFKFSVAGDAGLDPLTPGVAGSLLPDRISNHTIFDTVAQRAIAEDHLFFSLMGDIHYYNPGQFTGSTLSDHRRCIDDVLLQPRAANLYRNVPLVWYWDDHDFGPNDSDSTYAGAANGQQVYRERAPHYPLPDTEGIYQSFQIGRVLFMVWDMRSFKTPKSVADAPGKTMLGAKQKQWIKNTLQTSDASFLVVLQQTVWTHEPNDGSDSWSGYDYERTELGEMFKDLGWSNRMVMLGADAHTMAIDSGATNRWGDFPHALFASLDASPSSMTHGFDIGISNDRNQYGVVSIVDDAERIEITLTGYQTNEVWRTFSFEVDAPYEEEPGPPPDPTPPPAPEAPAEPVPTISWYAYDLRTLRKISHIQGVSGNVSRALGSSESSTLTIPTPLSGPMANRLITHQVTAPNTLIVAEINRLPAWCGIVWKTEESSTGGYSLGCATPESYLKRRYTRTLQFNQVEQVEIMGGLAAIAADEFGIPLEFDLEPTGILRDRSYFDDEDATLYKRIEELSEVINGPEWTIRAAYADEWGSQLRLIFTAKAVIGKGRDNPVGPISTLGAAKATWKLTNDWGDGAGANAVIATSSGQGSKRPQSVEISDIRSSVPKIEHRFSPSSSIKNISTLNDHAHARLLEIGQGTQSLEITARWDQEPVRLGIDLDIGDWAQYDLYGPTRPTGMTGVKRMLGYSMNPAAGTFSPVFLED